jgi:hypothetical protein
METQMKNQERVFTLVALCFALLGLIGIEISAQSPQLFQGPELEQFLTQAKITGMKDIPEGVTLPKKASLELNGTKHFAIFKTIDEGPVASKVLDRGVELQFQDSWRTEVAAYEIDKLIGLGMVPTTVERTYDSKHGSLQFWIDSAMTEADRIKKKLNPPNRVDWENQVSKIRLFDNLIYNVDRHLDNLLVTDNWKIRLIDHSRTFRPFDELKDPKMLNTFSRALLAKLEMLDEPMLKEHVGKYLSPYQIQGLLKRRDAILALSRKLVAEKGAGAVLYQ